MIKDALKTFGERVLTLSLRAASREQGLDALSRKLAEIAPDITAQYTNYSVKGEFLTTKVRGQHAFQMALAAPEVEALPDGTVVDIGDSSGTHVAYLKALLPGGKRRYVSVNLDEEAVRKVKARGFEAVLARAEELDRHGITADVFLSFETMEHLSDPVTFLHELAAKTRCRRLVLSVPYVRATRLGLHHIRAGLKGKVTAETVHIWELSPEDLRLLFKHSGWKVERELIYRQYPRWSPLRLTRWVWKRWDFEGFYGVVLSRDDSWSSLYTSWRDERPPS